MPLPSYEDVKKMKEEGSLASAFPVDQGFINFTVHQTVKNPEFVRVRKSVQKINLVKHAMSLGDHPGWGLDTNPGLLLRVTGSVSSLGSANRELQGVIEGVANAASTAKAWIFSTGLDFGVASLVGRVIARKRHVIAAPLIGVASWSTVQGSDQLLVTGKGKLAEPGQKRNYNDRAPDDDGSTVSLQANHSHFVLVGDPGDEKVPQEMAHLPPEERLLEARKQSFAFAHDLEHSVRAFQEDEGMECTPRVLFVINGDSTTLQEILAYCRHNEGKVLLAARTGGLAEALALFIEEGIIAPGWDSQIFHELKEMNERIAEGLDVTSRRRLSASAINERSMRAVHSSTTMRTAGNMSQRSTGLDESDERWPLFHITNSVKKDDVKEAVLGCTSAQATSISQRVMYAVRWDDAERLQAELTLVPTWAANRMDILRDALQLALELETEQAVKVCVENAAPAKEINLLKLHDKLYNTESPPKYKLFTGALPTSRRDRKKGRSPTPGSPTSYRNRIGSPKEKMKELSLSQPKALPAPTRGSSAGADRSSSSGGSFFSLLDEDDPEDVVMDYYAPEVWQTLKEIVPGLTLYWLAKIKAFNDESPESPGGDDRMSSLSEASIKASKKSLGARWIDIYVWAVLLGNNELALHLLPSCREPMRAAIIGARLCKFMAQKLPLDSIALNEAALQHEQFAVKLLDLCETFEEARRMLITKSRHWNRTVLQLGIQSGLRNFCAHGHCQTLCDEFLRGNLDAEKYQTILNLQGTPGLVDASRLVFRAMVPIRLPCFGAATRWSTPVGTDPDDALERGQTPRLDYYRIPAVKQLLRLTFHIGYVGFMSYCCMETQEKPDSAYVNWTHIEFHEGGGLENTKMDAYLCVWTVALAFDEWFKVAQDRQTFQVDFWNKYDYIVISSTLFALFARTFDLTFSIEMMAFTVLLVWCRLFKYLALSQDIGLLVIMIMEMFSDIATWTLVTLVFLGAFTVSFVSIADPFALHGSSPDHPLTAPLWAMLGHFDVHEVTDWNPNIGAPMLWTFVVVAQIILVNLLIAMMGHTFGVIKQRADEEWKFGRLRSVLEATERMHPVPPPLNLPITVFSFVRAVLFGIDPSKKDHEKGDKDAMTTAKKAKEKVAKKLMLAYKREIEDEQTHTLKQQVSSLTETQAVINDSIGDVMDKLRAMERQLLSMSAASSEREKRSQPRSSAFLSRRAPEAPKIPSPPETLDGKPLDSKR